MTTEPEPTGSNTAETARARRRLLAIGVLASVFALLVAASYTGVAVAVVTGTMAATVIGQGVTRLTNFEGIHLPHTDV